MAALDLWRRRYTSAGIATIPLVPYGKEPLAAAWQFVTPADQWQDAGGGGFRGNIGLRCGGGLAVADGDSLATVRNLRAFLEGLGYAAPEVKTVTPGHVQFYLKVDGVPSDFNYCRLPGDVGAGELRGGPGAYVVAPCSKVGDTRYRFVAGDPESYAALRSLRWRDLVQLASGWQAALPLAAHPVRLVWRPMPDRAALLLAHLRGAPKAVPVLGYATRSEAEAATVATLLLAGWDIGQIGATFDEWLPGHYAEKRGRHRAGYLALTCAKVLGLLGSTQERAALAELYHTAASWSWPARGGGLEFKTYQAVLSVGWQFSTWSPAASERVIAEHAGASRRGVSNALKRLAKAGLVRYGGRGDRGHGATWHITKRQYLPISHITTTISDPALSHPELWARDKLGASGKLVWHHLPARGEGVTARALADTTGKAMMTVRYALAKLAAVGLAESNASHPARWVRGAADPAVVANELGCAAAGQRRRARHQEQRERWQEKWQP